MVAASLLAAAVVAACVCGLVAWRWWLEHRQWALSRADARRDEMLESHEPRLKALEDRLKAMEYQRATR